jgi:hypothetical protein
MAINCDVFCNDISDALKRHNYESNKLDEEIRYLDFEEYSTSERNNR